MPLKKRKLECLRLESDRGCPLERRRREGGPAPEGEVVAGLIERSLRTSRDQGGARKTAG